MASSDNIRVLKEEKSILEAEEAFAREEQSILQRVEAVLVVSYADRGQQLVARIDALERAGVASPDLGRAREVIVAGIAADPVLAGGERTAALTARRSALQAREAALQALATALVQLEGTKQRRQQEFQAVEVFVAGTEAAVQQMLDQRRAVEAAATEVSAPVAPPAPTVEVAPAPKVAAPPPVVVAPKPVEPATVAATPKAKESPKAAEPKSKQKAPEAPAPVKSEPVKPEPVVASKPAAVASSALVAAKPAAKKVSRRRRVRLAPPPKRLSVEVAVYGDNNFYTGFENKIASGGVFVSSLETLPTGHELEVELDLEGKKIKSRGKVEFVRVDNGVSHDAGPGAGLKLLGLSGDSAAAIEAFFQKRPPLFVVPISSAA
jgi:outer membrane biosynthesis protein TonB